MCYLVTIGTREPLAAVEALCARDRGLAVQRSLNRSLEAIFPPADRLYELISGQCSCDLLAQRSEQAGDVARAKLREKHARNGWSEARSARALADWDKARQRRLERQSAPERAFHALLRALASRPGGVRVFVHFYSDGFEMEDVASLGQITIPVDRLGLAMPPDRLIDIVEQAQR